MRIQQFLLEPDIDKLMFMIYITINYFYPKTRVYLKYQITFKYLISNFFHYIIYVIIIHI